MRPVTACYACRSNKRKCRVNVTHAACIRCQALQLECNLDRANRLSVSQVKPPGTRTVILQGVAPQHDLGQTHHGQTPSQDLCVELVGLYFHEIHDTHHSIFHRPTIERRVRNGSLPDIFLYSMMALGARFSESRVFAGIERRHRGDEYAVQARTLLDLTDISVQTIQACILLGTVSFSESNTHSEALYYSIANRLACILDLPNRNCHHEVERQVNLRVWWSLYMIDIWSSMGLGLSRQFEFVEILPFPLDEQDFLSIRETQPLAKSSSRGLWAEMVMLARIWAGIHQLNRASADGLLVLSEVEAETQKLADELQAWSDRLHPSLQESHANLERYTRLGLGNAYAALHLGYHYYHEVLFYQFLGGPVHSESHSRQQWRIKCQKHAVAFCDLLYHCRALGQCQCVYVMVGHMLVITSTVYIHTLLFGDEEQKPLVRHRLVRNFKILTELQTFWAALDMALLRLQIFHNACMQSIDRSFCMDRWLLRFIQHGSSITERPLPDVEQSNDRSDRQSATDWWNWFLETL